MMESKAGLTIHNKDAQYLSVTHKKCGQQIDFSGPFRFQDGVDSAVNSKIAYMKHIGVIQNNDDIYVEMIHVDDPHFYELSRAITLQNHKENGCQA